MKYLKQFTILILLSFTGEMLNAVLPFPIPAGIYGIAILFLLLKMNVIKSESIRETGDFLMQIMPIMFIPPAVGIINSWHLVAKSWFSYTVITLVSTFIVMIVSGLVTGLIIRVNKEKDD